jgi:arylsulfotransferase ASST
MHRSNRSTGLAGLLLVLLGCTSTDAVAPPVQQQPQQPDQPDQPAAPRILAASVSANPYNALSAIVAFSAEAAESARVVFLDQNQTRDSTPYAGITGNDTIATLGLEANSRYRCVIELKGSGGTAFSDTLSSMTGALPELLTRLHIATTGASRGLTLGAFQIGGTDVFAVAFDAAGEIRWYRRFAGTERTGGELKQQPNGNFTLYRGESHGSQAVAGSYVEFSGAGDSLRAITVPPPRYLDNHELLITAGADGDERFHLFSYDFRPSHLMTRRGTPVSLAGHQLVRLQSDGSTEFEWNAWDHFTLNEWTEPKPSSMPDEFDFDHPNSIDFDRDGNYIVSFRRLGQILKIDAVTGEVIWRLGGRRGEFTVVDDPLGGFSNQHSVRVLPNGHLLLFDNGGGHLPQESRAAEYELDTGAKTARLVWEYRPSPAIYTPGGGAVERLENGNTFVAFSQEGHAVEVAPDGTVRWEAELTVDGKRASLYRLARIASLYRRM